MIRGFFSLNLFDSEATLGINERRKKKILKFDRIWKIAFLKNFKSFVSFVVELERNSIRGAYFLFLCDYLRKRKNPV